MPTTPTLAFIPSETSFLLDAPLDPIPSAARSINSCIRSQVHGVSYAHSQVLRTTSSLPRTQNGLRRSTPPICPHTQRNRSLLSHLTAPIAVMVNYTSRSANLHLRKPVFMVSPLQRLSKWHPTFLHAGTFAISISPLWPNSMTRLPLSHGRTRRNAYASCLVMTLMFNPSFTMGHHLRSSLTDSSPLNTRRRHYRIIR